MALSKPGQQFSFDDLRNELALGAGPVSLTDPRVLDMLDRQPTDISPISFDTLNNQPSYRPPASLEFNSAVRQSRLTRTIPAGATASTWSVNAWVKQRGQDVATILTGYLNVGNSDLLCITGEGRVDFSGITAGVSFRWRFQTTKAWAANQWINVHVTADISSAVSDRMRIWVNGERQTDFSVASQPIQNSTAYMNSASNTNSIGSTDGGLFSRMRLADIIFLDNLILGPEYFGEYSGGYWVPKRFDITKYPRGPASYHMNFADRSSINSALVNLSNGTQTMTSGPVSHILTDVTLDRPRIAGLA